MIWLIYLSIASSLTMMLTGCYTAPTPVIIRDIPRADVSADMTIEDYMQTSTTWAVQITAYVKELINQVIHKVPFVDLRSKQDAREQVQEE